MYSRRKFLKMAGLGAGTALITACMSEILAPTSTAIPSPAGIATASKSPFHPTAAVTSTAAKSSVSVAGMYDNIASRLDSHVVGYACTVGGDSITSRAYGFARTKADAPARPFLPSTKITVASVSKVVTALAAIRVLAKNHISLDTGIGQHLPSDWKLDPYVASITFRELLSHRSGIKDYGNNSQDYATLQKFFTQSVDPASNTKCQPASVVDPPNAINPNDKSSCYSNYNFAIFRVLLPLLDGFVDSPVDRAAKLATAYIKIVQANVFEPVGVQGVDAKPPATGPQADGYAFSYKFPGTSRGVDWGSDTLGVGAAGWYLAIDDIAKVLYSLNKNDGRILSPSQLQDMETTPLGWDIRTDSRGYPWVEKNGAWGSGGTLISTSIALFGPGLFGALFINSDFAGPGLENNWFACSKCQEVTFSGGAAPGPCAAGGQHDNGSEFLVPTKAAGTPGDEHWLRCNKCQALTYGGGTSLGPCPAGGSHAHGGSQEYVLAVEGGSSLPVEYQVGWRRCDKCQSLIYAGGRTQGECAAGGSHQPSAQSAHDILGLVLGADTVLHDAYLGALKSG